MNPRRILPLLAAGVVVLRAAALPVPTTLADFHLPGSQPGQSGTLENPSQCDNCHSGYGEPLVEPVLPWKGSMMAQAMRDPFFGACLAIANQDAPQSGDLCLRCHTPKGWLEGRSEPTDGSALTAADTTTGEVWSFRTGGALSAPLALLVAWTPIGLWLEWSPVAEALHDRVYRMADPRGVPGGEDLVAEVAETHWLDAQGLEGRERAFYVVTAYRP